MSSRSRPFQLPDFYIGWPARLNPHLQSARTHSKTWARDVGILDTPDADDTPEIWTEEQLDAMDFGLLCAYAHPDVLPDGLDLATDWHVWIFYFDDHFVEAFKRTGDIDGARASLERLALFMALDPADAPPEPTNPVQRGLHDLWMRTVPNRSRCWRERLRTATLTVMDGFDAELVNIQAGRVANPIEFIELRRAAGAVLWVGLMVELASLVEVPARVHDSRPLRALVESFGDTICLRNDIFSYQREIADEIELANMVLVLGRFFDLTPQDAADMTSDIASSRLQQFENTAVTEVPAMFEEASLGVAEREAVELYVKGLQDYQAGVHEWHLLSDRYQDDGARGDPPPAWLGGPTGLGTAAVRAFRRPTPRSTGLTRLRAHAHVPHEQVEPLAIVDLKRPFPSRVNPGYDEAHRDTIGWCRELGMLEALPGLPGSGIWTERQLAGFDFCYATARFFPDASTEQLVRASRWVVWGTYADDYFPRVYGTRRDMAGAKVFNARLSLFMPLDGVSMPPPSTPVERGLADLWPGTASLLSHTDRATFRDVVERTFASWLWELQNHIQNRIPDPVDYVEMRRWTLGAELMMLLGRLETDKRLCPEVLASRPLLAIENAAKDYVGLLNDIASYYKEIRFEGELNNGVLVTQSFLGIEPQQAARVVADLMTQRMRELDHVLTGELASVVERFELGHAARSALDERVESIRNWVAGMFDWTLTSERYAPEHVRRRYTPETTAGVEPVAPADAASPSGPATDTACVASRLGSLVAHPHRGFRATSSIRPPGV